MKKFLLALGIGLLIAGIFSSSCKKYPTGSTSSSSGLTSNLTTGDIYATVYITNPPGPFVGGTVTLDGGNPVVLNFTTGTPATGDVRLYPAVPNGTHTIAYTDFTGTTATCQVGVAGTTVSVMSICYTFNGGVLISNASCGYKIYYSCP